MVHCYVSSVQKVVISRCVWKIRCKYIWLERGIATTATRWSSKSSSDAVISEDATSVSKKLHQEVEEKDPGPIQYSTSKAGKWQAKQTFRIIQDPMYGPPRYQPIVVRLCLIVFLMYFCVLREENDVDDKLRMGLFDHNTDLNEEELVHAIKKHDEVGMSSADLQEKLRLLRESGQSSSK